MKVFHKGDIEIKYKVEGDSGPVYIFLHGFGGSPTDWREAAAHLSVSNRVVMPNLKVFFSHAEPLTFTRQVHVLKDFVEHIYKQKDVQVLNLVGQSYGATLSLGLRLSGSFNVHKHILINPMLLAPLRSVRNIHVKRLLYLGSVPGGVYMFLRTKMGRQSLAALAQFFRIGALGQHEISKFNNRKLMLVGAAFKRFRWIDRHEDWAYWEQLVKSLSPGAISDFYYSDADGLFSKEDYRQFAKSLKVAHTREIAHEGHLLVQDFGYDLFKGAI